jgi:FkbM family methyltransferase
MYSQNREEEVILANLPAEGKVLDIGAYDGVVFSNSRALIEKGWSGVLIEPSPIVFSQLIQNTEAYQDRVTLVNGAVVSGDSGFVTFYDSMGDAISGYDPAHLDKWDGHLKWRPFILQTINLVALLDKIGTEFDFVTIDTEGTNMELLKAMPWSDMPTVKMVCVEYDNRAMEMVKHMEDNGFFLVHRNGENLIFQKR